ncbi:hypothetical protein [Amycolatopsis kentuckyensis]|uniref:hypothetical protein n=1 Tax=Amycolatopsis kentuckyensis TaxID=218823 RepID=UPI000A3BF90D|nr:hypothetical protein [Amycolatopsis kentuckyensis]
MPESKFDHGPIKTFEVTWTNGHVEEIKAHQVILPLPDMGGMYGELATKRVDYIKFHGEIDGRWQLVLAVRAGLIDVVRDKATETL